MNFLQAEAPLGAARMASARERFELVTTPEGLLALRGEWAQLCERCPGHLLGQRFDWAWLCWEVVARPRGRRIACVVARSEGRLVLVWPLAIDAGRPGRVMAHPLDSETSECADVLVEPGPEAWQRVLHALHFAHSHLGCDLLELENVRPGTVLDRVLASRGAADAVSIATLAASGVQWRAAGSWPDYLAARDAKERRELGRKKRRMAEAGELRIEEVRDAAEAAQAIDWSLSRKLEWLRATGRTNDWIGEPEHRTLLVSSIEVFGAAGARRMFVMRHAGEIVATLLTSVDDVRMEWFMIAATPDMASLSPTQILREHVLQWACERGLDVDFRLGDNRWKAFWGNTSQLTTTWWVGMSPRGRATVLSMRLRRWLAEQLSGEARGKLKAALRGLLRP